MPNKKKLTCYLIGEDHLVIKCAEILLNKGIKIMGIISPLSAAQKFSFSHKIEYFFSFKEASATLLSIDYDYLFSIINSSIIPKSILQRAKKLSINFHNAPLPHYAGVHALSWAILNNETQHGVTWHEMTEKIDGGNLLKQELFFVDAHETALSLSLKCYDKALSLFDELLNELLEDRLCIQSQDSTQRSYYSFQEKPIGNGWISWNNTAADIERIVRALDLGHYHENRLATPKFNMGNNIYIINRLHILKEASTAIPGTLSAIHPYALHISTKTNLVSLEQVSTIDGIVCSLEDLLMSQNLKIGDILPSPTVEVLERYRQLSQYFSASELFWVRELRKFKPITLPFQLQNNQHSIKNNLISLAQYSISKEQIDRYRAQLPTYSNFSDVLLTILLIYLYRLCNRTNADLWFFNLQSKNPSYEQNLFFASFLPFAISLEPKMNFYEAIELVKKTRLLIENKETFQKDVFCRYPELSDREHQQPSLALLMGTTNECISNLQCTTSSILITLSTDTQTLTWWVQETLVNQEPRLDLWIKSSISYFKQLINSLPSNGEQPISHLPLMEKEVSQKILTQWHTTVTDYPKDKTIHQIFEEQAILIPNNTAVFYDKKSLSYKELNEKANQLARCLQKKGLTPGDFVALCTAQELHLVIGILAILKSGAAYIPIDSNYPKQHIKNVLEDSKPRLLLASDHLNKRIEQDCRSLNIPIYQFTALSEEMKFESINNLKYINATAKSLAYIIYTSGSTGKPKGVMVPHQGVNRLVINTNYINITKQDKIAQAASISFDAATFEIWGALLNGATLIAVPHATLLNPLKFALFLEKKEITILWLTSALFNQYADQDPSMFRNLTYLLVGGDVLNKERIMSVLECKYGSPKTLINGYGPTENTTFTTTYCITKKDKVHENIPIGKPISNSTVYILDEFLQPTPIGSIGELYTGGDGLALGYLNRPDLNEKQFIKNPFCFEKTSLLYKTGDSVRWMPDGNIEYIGRQDNQVKIRGFRVELEAIQAHLLHHDDISQCCVRAEDSKKQGKILVAYIVNNKPINDNELNNFLSNQLPIYMIPSFFVYLEKMPLTANGKINYKKLPKPDFSKKGLNKEYTPPTTAREQSLTKLWIKLLGCESIGMNDNFFDLGGHSLLITQLILEVKKQYKADLPLHEFLEQPTISHLSQLIRGDKPESIPHSYYSTLLSDRVLPKQLQLSETIKSSKKVQHIFLTGATGFLGAHLLHALYHSSSAIIYCLIRANNDDEARNRLNETLFKYQLNIQCNERITPLAGDLTNPKLGLTESRFNHLSDIIDIIVHNGAAVNHLYNYEQLRRANVCSTQDIILLAMKNKIKSIHYVSTLSAASSFLDESKNIREDFINIQHNTTPPIDGYSQTKWVSEHLLSEAYSRGLAITIYRPGWIVGQSKTGAINTETNHLFKLIKGCVQLKAAPCWDMSLDMLPVDIISQIIIKNALLNSHESTVFNLINPNKISWSHLIQYINLRGYKISLIEPSLWKEQHLKFINEDNALFSLYPLYINSSQQDWMKGLATISKANSCNFNKKLNEFEIEMPKMHEPLFDIYFDYLEKQSFITPTNQKE